MTNAEWAYLALKCKAQGFQPRGNNNYGADISDATERGEIALVRHPADKIRASPDGLRAAWMEP